MSDAPDYRPCEVELEFGDGSYLFRLPLKQIAEVQSKRNAPIGEIYRRVLTSEYYAEDLVEICRHGLIGGGATGIRASELIDRYCDTWPIEIWHVHALAVLGACIHGYAPPETEKKSEADPGSPMGGSPSPAPSETEPSSAEPLPET